MRAKMTSEGSWRMPFGWAIIALVVAIGLIGLTTSCEQGGDRPLETPVSSQWRCVMFFPYKLFGTHNEPPWNGYESTDSNHFYADRSGQPWEDDYRINGFKWVQSYGGNTTIYKSESLFGKTELQMRLTNRKSPVDGQQVNDRDNWVVKARAYGIDRWIVSLFGVPFRISADKHEAYIKEMADCYAWATRDQVAFLLGLECDRNMSSQEAIRLAQLVKKYAPGKRVLVGAASMTFLQEVAQMDPSLELWVEADRHPFNINMGNADQYLSKLRMLRDMGRKVWAGEYGDGNNIETLKYITGKATEMGCDMGCGYFR